MQIAVLDTGILIDLLKNGPRKEQVNQYLESEDFTTVISVVTKAELMAIAKKRNWGDGKIRELEGLLASFVYFDIEYNNPELLNAYAAIDAFSQGRTPAPDGNMLNDSSRNMGKNDLWIAATAHALDATLLTTDSDFEHLHQVYFELRKF